MQEEEGYLSTACAYIKKALAYLWMLWDSLSFAVRKFSIY